MYKQPHPKVGGLKWYMRTLVDHFYHIYDLKFSPLQPKARFSFEFIPLRLLICENPFQALSTKLCLLELEQKQLWNKMIPNLFN